MKDFRATILPWLGGPRVFTLGFVKKYFASRLVSISTDLMGLFAENFALADNAPIPEKSKAVMRKHLESMSEALEELGLRMTKLTVDRFLDILPTAHGRTSEGFYDEVNSRFIDEIEGFVFFYIHPEKRAYYDSPFAFGQDVHEKFPSARRDIREAGNCFAASCHTATVMHCMRVLEFGLDAVGKALRVKRGTKGWGRDLNNFTAKWASIEKAWKPGKRPLGWKRKFYPSIFAELRYFENAWRNHAMHAHANYDVEEASRVFEHVKTFMQLISARLREKKSNRLKPVP